jgi:hypothetical protein
MTLLLEQFDEEVAPDDFKLFAQGDVVDDVVGIRIPLKEIFS